MDIRRVGDHECIQCGECIDVCPTQAIQWKGPKILLAPQAIGGSIATKENANGAEKTNTGLVGTPRKTRVARAVAWVLALALLGGALYYFNFAEGKDKTPPQDTSDTAETETPAEGETGEPLPPRGNEVGTLCVNTRLDLYTGGDTFSVDENRGKVTVINFWGTWCGPCIAELPHFEQVAKDYADTVTVVAVHSNYRGNTAAEWISQNYPDTAILFAQDPDDGANGAYYTALGGEGDFPMTFVVDADGVLTFVCRGSVTHDELVAAVEEALKK
jgi:thiol-disulfide isomerase/thioredoxin